MYLAAPRLLVGHVGSLIIVVACGIYQLWHVGSSSLTRDRIWTSCIGSWVSATEPPGKSLLFVFLITSQELGVLSILQVNEQQVHNGKLMFHGQLICCVI